VSTLVRTAMNEDEVFMSDSVYGCTSIVEYFLVDYCLFTHVADIPVQGPYAEEIRDCVHCSFILRRPSAAALCSAAIDQRKL